MLDAYRTAGTTCILAHIEHASSYSKPSFRKTCPVKSVRSFRTDATTEAPDVRLWLKANYASGFAGAGDESEQGWLYYTCFGFALKVTNAPSPIPLHHLFFQRVVLQGLVVLVMQGQVHYWLSAGAAGNAGRWPAVAAEPEGCSLQGGFSSPVPAAWSGTQGKPACLRPALPVIQMSNHSVKEGLPHALPVVVDSNFIITIIVIMITTTISIKILIIM